MRKFEVKWREDKKWLESTENGGMPKKDAPKEIWDSYNKYQKQLKEYYSQMRIPNEVK